MERYDRFVIEVSGAVPSYTVTSQSDSRFTLTPKGGTLTLEGTNGVLITVRPTTWTAYAGPTSLRPEFTYLREAHLIQNFEGVHQWGLGIAGIAAVRVFTLTSPARLVVDGLSGRLQSVASRKSSLDIGHPRSPLSGT